MIRKFAFAFACLFVSQTASADTRDVYTITDIPVDERAESVLEAQQKHLPQRVLSVLID